MVLNSEDVFNFLFLNWVDVFFLNKWIVEFYFEKLKKKG